MKNYIKKVTKTMAKEIARQFFGSVKAETVSEPKPAIEQKQFDDTAFVFVVGKTKLTISSCWNTREKKSPYIWILMRDSADDGDFRLVGECEFVDGELKTHPYFGDCREVLESIASALNYALNDDGTIYDKDSLMTALKLAKAIDKKEWW